MAGKPGTKGRPSKLTPEVQQRVCDAVRAGNYLEAAAAYAGITYATLRRWMERGEKAKQGVFCDFCAAVLKAQADAEVAVVAQWRQHMPESHQACRDYLGRRFPERWGRKDQTKTEITGPDGTVLVVKILGGGGASMEDL